MTATIDAFTTSWRFSNYTIKDGNHGNKGAIKTKTVEIKTKVFLEVLLPATMASNSAIHAGAVLASSMATRRVA